MVGLIPRLLCLCWFLGAMSPTVAAEAPVLVAVGAPAASVTSNERGLVWSGPGGEIGGERPAIHLAAVPPSLNEMLVNTVTDAANSPVSRLPPASALHEAEAKPNTDAVPAEPGWKLWLSLLGAIVMSLLLAVPRRG